jgi:hypothetical protein
MESSYDSIKNKFTNIRSPVDDEKEVYYNHFSEVMYIMQLKGGLAVLVCLIKPKYQTSDKKFYLFVIGGISAEDITHNLYAFLECNLSDCMLLDFDEVCSKLEAYSV